ncbi:phosphohistidine phosphatase SixA [Moraxella nasovis]|uniref:phosphohistidine phosphatase SixA n=1 Tax=Moraxella nasovis TaxID=2904121 RepID=UPI001F61F183|nr:phosphohistidine phosphatase SixA [Moraxella nasovis]UNU73193.1 phosphohistidine phosphatase SixA [Moraxella nasovis]
MKLIFIRHGQAHPIKDTDAVRELTAFGRKQASSTADWLSVHYQIDLIISSPYTRAIQTADIIADKVGSPQRLQIDGITPDDNPMAGVQAIDEAILQYFDGKADDKTVAIVCHMPIISSMVAILDGNTPTYFDLAACSVLDAMVVAPEYAKQINRFIPSQ